MDTIDFDGAIRQAQRELERLTHAAQFDEPDQSELAARALAILESSIKELRVAQEVILRQQHNIFERHQTTERHMERLKYLLSMLADGYLVTDSGGIIQEAGYGAVDLLVNPSRDTGKRLTGRPLASLVAIADRLAFRRFLARARLLDHGKLAETHARLVGRDAELVEVNLVVLRPPIWDDGAWYWLIHVRAPEEDERGASADERLEVIDVARLEPYCSLLLAASKEYLELLAEGHFGHLTTRQERAIATVQRNIGMLARALERATGGP